MQNDVLSISYTLEPIVEEVTAVKRIDNFIIPDIRGRTVGQALINGTNKYVKEYAVQNSSFNIPIQILGTPGSKFTLTIIDDNANCSILKEPLVNVEIPENGVYNFNQTYI